MREEIFRRSGRDAPAVSLLAVARFLLGACLLTLAACGTGGQPRVPSLIDNVAASDAFVVPPPGGPAVVEVLERRYPNATEQRIFLRSTGTRTGQNYFLVQYFGPVGWTGQGRTALANPPLSVTNINAEIRDVFPDIQMMRSDTYVQNRYGPFGYAVGRSPSGDTCLYAWQRLSGISSAPLIFRAKGTIQIRLRMCGAGNVEQRLLSTMYGLTIKAAFNDPRWDPYGAPPAADPRLGATEAPIYPTGAGGFETVVEAEPTRQPVRSTSRPARRSEPAARAAPPAPEPDPLPAPVGTPVPPPPGTGTAPTGEAAATTAAPSVARARTLSSPQGAAPVLAADAGTPTLEATGPAVPPPPAGLLE